MRRLFFAVPCMALSAVAGAVGFQALPGHAATAPSGQVANAALPSQKVLSLGMAQKAANVALDNCTARGFAVSVAVIDADGVSLVQLRKEGATGATVNVAFQKASAAAGFRSPTSGLDAAAKANPGLIAIDGFNILGGGLPIASGTTALGGIGVSGTPSGDIDEACATAGLNAIAP